MTTRKGSGEHEAVKAFRAKAVSFAEHTIPMLKALEERVEKGIASAPPEANTAATSAPPSGSVAPSSVIVITIHACGPHGGKLPADVARLAAGLVEDLRALGHTTTFASIAHGGEDVVIVRPTPTGDPTP